LLQRVAASNSGAGRSQVSRTITTEPAVILRDAVAGKCVPTNPRSVDLQPPRTCNVKPER
jgi:hypothetical protein